MKAILPVSFPKNSPQVAVANEGTIALGWVNHYYLHRLDKEGGVPATTASPKPVMPAMWYLGWCSQELAEGRGCGGLHCLAVERANADLLRPGWHEYSTRPAFRPIPMWRPSPWNSPPGYPRLRSQISDRHGRC